MTLTTVMTIVFWINGWQATMTGTFESYPKCREVMQLHLKDYVARGWEIESAKCEMLPREKRR